MDAADSPSALPPAEEEAGGLKQRSNAVKLDPPESAPKRALPFQGAAKSSRAKFESKVSARATRKRGRKIPAAVPSSDEDEGEDPPKKRILSLVDGGTIDDPIDVDQYASMWDPAPSNHYVSHVTFGLAVAYPRVRLLPKRMSRLLSTTALPKYAAPERLLLMMLWAAPMSSLLRSM